MGKRSTSLIGAFFYYMLGGIQGRFFPNAESNKQMRIAETINRQTPITKFKRDVKFKTTNNAISNHNIKWKK